MEVNINNTSEVKMSLKITFQSSHDDNNLLLQLYLETVHTRVQMGAPLPQKLSPYLNEDLFFR